MARKKRKQQEPEQEPVQETTVQEPKAQSAESSGFPAKVTYIVGGKRVDAHGNVVKD